MQNSGWAYIAVVVLTCSVAYQHFYQPSLLTKTVGPAQSEQRPLEQNPELPLTYEDDGLSDEGRVEASDSAPPALEKDRLPDAQKEADLKDATGTVTIGHSEPNEIRQNFSYLAYYAY